MSNLGVQTDMSSLGVQTDISNAGAQIDFSVTVALPKTCDRRSITDVAERKRQNLAKARDAKRAKKVALADIQNAENKARKEENEKVVKEAEESEANKEEIKKVVKEAQNVKERKKYHKKIDLNQRIEKEANQETQQAKNDDMEEADAAITSCTPAT